MWDPQVERSRTDHLVIRYDRRGMDRLPLPGGDITVADLGATCSTCWTASRFERASFCGISIGGAVGMWLALNAPERLDRLVLACTRAAFLPPSQWVDRAAVVRERGLAALADAVLERWFTPSFFIAHPTDVARFREMLVSTPAEGYIACCVALAGSTSGTARTNRRRRRS